MIILDRGNPDLNAKTVHHELKELSIYNNMRHKDSDAAHELNPVSLFGEVEDTAKNKLTAKLLEFVDDWGGQDDKLQHVRIKVGEGKLINAGHMFGNVWKISNQKKDMKTSKWDWGKLNTEVEIGQHYYIGGDEDDTYPKVNIIAKNLKEWYLRNKEKIEW